MRQERREARIKREKDKKRDALKDEIYKTFIKTNEV